MSPTSESKRNNRKGKKKRALQTKENQPPENTDTNLKSNNITEPSSDSSVPLSQVVNKAHLTPLLDGDRCILCHQERPKINWRGGGAGNNSHAAGQLIETLPLWVCADCRKKVEEEELRASGMDTASVNDHVLPQSDASVMSSLLPEVACKKNVCNCHVCAGKRHLVPGKTKELQELQYSWFEVRHFVRCVYRETGTTLSDDDKSMSCSQERDRIKRHAEKLTSKDPDQFFARLEAQTKEYLAEVRMGLIKFFSSSFSNSVEHAKDCIAAILDEYQSVCVATDILKPLLAKLESTFLKKFELTWELLNKKTFYSDVFENGGIQSHLPSLITVLRPTRPISSCALPVPAKEAQKKVLARFHLLGQEMTLVDERWEKVQSLKDKYFSEKNICERWKNPDEDWDCSVENGTDVKGKEFCGCDHCIISSNPHFSGNQLSESSLSPSKRSCSSSSSSSSVSCTTCCPRHSHNSSTDHDLGNMPSSQLLPTALFLNGLTNTKCSTCMREALHSFCFDQKHTATKCRNHEEQDKEKASLLNPLSCCEPYHIPSCQNCDNHETHDVRCPLQHCTSTSSVSPETSSSIQSLLFSGSSGDEKCRNHNGCDKVSEWKEEDECGEGCEGHGHRGASSPSIIIPGNNVNLEAPPSSPSSVRSNGDGSSCDTPTSRSSLSEDGRPNNAKYCDCCYCEFFGPGAPPTAQTSHNFVEIREKLRIRLKEKEKEKKHVDFSDHQKQHDCSKDDRSVEELLTFINGDTTGDTGENQEVKMSSKAAKRQRQKMKKAAEKGNHVIEADEKGYCLLRPRTGHNIEDRPPNLEEKTRKSSRQKKSGTTQALLETQKQNAKNSENTSNCAGKNDANVDRVATHQDAAQKNLDEKPAVAKLTPVKQGNGPKASGHNDKRKKRKEKHCAPANESRDSANGQERRVIVNGNGGEPGRYVEHTRGARLPVREEAESRHCGEECPPIELQTQNDSQGKKSKARKKKKNGSLDDVFLPRENVNGHSGEVDEAERELEEFKRFCAVSVAPASRKLKLPATINLKNLNLGLKKT